MVDGRRVARGFVARNSLQIRVDDLGRAGEVVDGAVQAGATSLNGIRFDLKDRAVAEREAVRLAVGDARGRIEAAAAGAGRGVDRVLKIEESRVDFAPPRPMVSLARAGAATTDIEPGLIEIRSQVVVTASMK